MHELYFDKVRRRLGAALPGEKAQLKMAAAGRTRLGTTPMPDAATRTGAVLILFYPHGGLIHVPMIRRPVYPGVHSGQVAFPGGRADETDESIIATALREAHEEVGVRPAEVEVLGLLTPLFVHASNFMVHPVVGAARSRPDFRPDPYEVDALLEVPLTELQDITRIGSKEIIVREGIAIQAPYYDLQGHTVWGATAMMISELLEVLGSLGNWEAGS
ncbi:MAG: CoA pyrophosphatase [Cytophagales bacterium]|nr:CoA pyrophosphatase [Cytophagales bacterium]